MIRDLSRLSSTRFDVLVVGGGIHGLAIAYDAAQRGLSTALVERGDFGSGSSFNHAKTVHGGLRSLQTGDVRKARFSVLERRAMARIAPNFVEPLCFMMATTRKLTRSRAAMAAGFALDATIGADRNDGVPSHLYLPAGRVVSRATYEAAFGANASRAATGGARWCDYHMPESDRLTLAVARAADSCGAALATYVEAVTPKRNGASVTGVTASDRLTGREFEIEARLVVTAAGAFSAHWMSLLGGRPTFPLIKAANVVTSRRAGDLALGAPTSGGRLLLVMPWQGRALVGTSHSEVPVDAGDSGVSPGELASFLDEINSAFPAMALGAADITLVHRGVVPGVRQRDGRLGLLGHHVVHDHRRDGVSGAISVAGVKYTTGRGVGEQVVDRAYEMLGTRRAPCRTGTTLLPGAFASPMQAEIGTACREAEGLLERTLMAGVVRTHGTVWRGILALCRAEPSLARPVAPGCDVPAAVLVHAVREEMALTLTDVVVRRSGIGAAGYPGPAVAQACARIVAPLLGWDEARISAELDALKAFYLPIVV